MARQYKRDARGRFASGGTLGARASLRKSRQKLAANPTPAQKAAVTRGNKKLREAKKDATVRVAGRRGGTIARPKGYVRPGAKPEAAASKPATKAAAKAVARARGTLAARASLRASQAKLAGKPTAAQKGAVTRGKKKLQQAKKESTVRIAGRRGGTIGRPKGYVRPGAGKRSSAPAKSGSARRQALTPSQQAGQRRRNSERPEARLERAQARSSRRLSELQSKKSSLETALRRRRGKLDEASKKVAARELARTNRSIQRVKDAEALYRQDINLAKAGRALKMHYRTGKKAPDTEATRRNRLGVLRRRVSFLKKDEVKPRDVWGGEYDGPLLTAARKELTRYAATGMRGLRVTFRTKKQAAAAQRTRTNALIKQAGATKRSRDGTVIKPTLYTKTVRLPITRQGNLLTGSVDRVRGRRFLPAKRRR